ncbi:MerC domain-containing protein [Flavihumibacter profundi]|uniref:MerC domain-containing protein n=1 Tax=Flavihumibacter profundi TaxID=2716883 RepID=UPI001CC63C3D|nr:MerC domain-containing protein [Flavihumibacter profundi]MBZ5859033.1 MerC domain-containing protein [Flavihumibacter profundi]
MSFKINLDALGIATSVACAIHCAVLPLLLTSLPVFGINIVENVPFEYFMIFSAAAIGANSLYHGYKSHHHKAGPVIIFGIGILFLLAKQRWHYLQLWFLVPAVTAIIFAHFRNFQLCQKANHCHAGDCNH